MKISHYDGKAVEKEEEEKEIEEEEDAEGKRRSLDSVRLLQYQMSQQHWHVSFKRENCATQSWRVTTMTNSCSEHAPDDEYMEDRIPRTGPRLSQVREDYVRYIPQREQPDDRARRETIRPNQQEPDMAACCCSCCCWFLTSFKRRTRSRATSQDTMQMPSKEKIEYE